MRLLPTNPHSTNDIHLAREIKGSVAKSENCHWLAWVCKRRCLDIIANDTVLCYFFTCKSRLILRFNQSVGNTYILSRSKQRFRLAARHMVRDCLLCRNEKIDLAGLCKINGLMIFLPCLHRVPCLIIQRLF